MKIRISKSIIVTVIMILCLIAIETLIYETARFLGGTPTMLKSELDNKIPFITAFIYPYISWYLMLFLVPIIIYINKPQNFYSYTATSIFAIITAFIIFVIFPTTVNRPEVIIDDFTTYVTHLVFSMDAPPVCCLPSMHCALCFLFILYTINIKELKPNIRILITIWSLVITISTLYIKQHVIYDILASIILVFISHVICKKFKLYKITEKLHRHLCNLIKN